jgi:predicted butyrate kinase (DUF1464 family)
MDKRIFYLVHATARDLAKQAIDSAPEGYRVTIEPPKRSLEQNDKFHALCSDIAKVVPFAGKMRSAVEWKVLLVSGHAMATKLGSEMVPGLEGEFVNIRESSARMSVARLSSLIEYTTAYAITNGVTIEAWGAHGYEY